MQTVTGAAVDLSELDELCQKIERWRGQKPRTRAMPEELWEQASEAARSFGVARVSKAPEAGLRDATTTQRRARRARQVQSTGTPGAGGERGVC